MCTWPRWIEFVVLDKINPALNNLIKICEVVELISHNLLLQSKVSTGERGG